MPKHWEDENCGCKPDEERTQIVQTVVCGRHFVSGFKMNYPVQKELKIIHKIIIKFLSHLIISALPIWHPTPPHYIRFLFTLISIISFLNCSIFVCINWNTCITLPLYDDNSLTFPDSCSWTVCYYFARQVQMAGSRSGYSGWLEAIHFTDRFMQ